MLSFLGIVEEGNGFRALHTDGEESWTGDGAIVGFEHCEEDFIPIVPSLTFKGLGDLVIGGEAIAR